jgi:uncharacterized repeat protein (TIGR01451 family)
VVIRIGAGVAVLLGALLLALRPLPARASHVTGATYTGTHDRGGSVTLTLSHDGTGVASIQVTAVPYDCGVTANQSVSYTPPIPIVTTGGTHSFSSTPPDGVSLTGSFPASGSAQGAFRDTFQVPGQPRCTSPTLNWTTTIPPDLALTKSHTGNFTVGTNGIYTLTVSNTAAAGSTSGTITVTDTLSTGLSYVSGSGAGWTCAAAGQAVTCTNPGPIAAGASSTINPAVGMAQTAVPSATNATSVATPGDSNAANNTTSDTTVVLNPPRPAVRISAVADGPGRLRVTVTAGCGALRELRFPLTPGPVRPLVDVPGGPMGQPGGFNWTPPPATPEAVFYVRRAAPGAFTVPFIVVDDCGPWRTFVGAGVGVP